MHYKSVKIVEKLASKMLQIDWQNPQASQALHFIGPAYIDTT
jgi:hypothetical protein